MQRDEIIEMAKEAGALTVFRMPIEHKLIGNAALEAFAKLVAAKEREECVRRAHIALLGTLESTACRVIHAIQTRGQE